MILSVKDWVFDVDIDATMDYSSELYTEHCECGYCRNYYSAVRTSYPGLESVLLKFGINIESPVDFLPVEPTLCIVSYAVCGIICKKGSGRILFDGFDISIQESAQLDYSLSCQQPYFVITTSMLDLPWLLDEDMDEVVSPANEPECLERMWRKLLNETDHNVVQS